jgi:hypothetical protein
MFSWMWVPSDVKNYLRGFSVEERFEKLYKYFKNHCDYYLCGLIPKTCTGW